MSLVEYLKKLLHIVKIIRIKSLKKNSFNMSDEEYVSKLFKIKTHHKLNLKKPTTYCEKLQWIKLYDHNPLYTQLADKYAVRNYVEDKIGSEYLIPLIKVWNDPNDINFAELPNSFVIKCNHNSGVGLVICKNKDKLDEKKSLEFIKKGFNDNYFYEGREWPYKNIPKKIVCEQFISELNGNDVYDYKFFCFDGKFKFLLVCSNRFTKLCNDWYDEKLKHLRCYNVNKNNKNGIVLPENINEMISIAEKLSSGLKHVRVDLYSVDNKIYFGEMTFFESGGFSPFKPKKYEYLFGSFIKI